MQFKVRVVKSVVWPVSANIPVNGGKTEKHEFFAEFNRLSPDEYQKLALTSDLVLLTRLVKAVGETESSLSTDKKVISQLAKTNYYATAIVKAYNEMDMGVEEKN